MKYDGSSTDCSETRALLAALVQNDDRARMEIRTLSPWERVALARACRRVTELCGDQEADRPAWMS